MRRKWRLAKISPLLIAVFIIVNPAIAHADLSTNQSEALHEGVLYFNTEDCGASTGTSQVNLSGNGNEQKIWNYLTGQGLTDAQAAGVMGNMEQESSFNPAAHQTSNSWNDLTNAFNDAVGLVQWDGGNRVALINAAHKAGLSTQDLESASDKNLTFQLQYMWDQMNGTSPTGVKDMLAGLQNIKGHDASAAAQAATYFNGQFESGSDPSGIREHDAQQVLNDAQQNNWKGGTGSGGNTNSSSCQTSTSTCTPSTGKATGNGAILCEAKKYAGAFYVWGGGPHGAGEYTAFAQKCPENNIANLAAKSTSNNPGPCGTDCSGLVSAALDGAFHQNLGWIVSGGTHGGFMTGNDASDWRKIQISQAQPGDIVTLNDNTGHVEVVDHVANGKVVTFGTRSTGTPASSATNPISYWTYAFHWAGPGSGN